MVASLLIGSALRRATGVVCVSQSTYDDVSRFAKGRKSLLSKMRVVPNVLDPFFLRRTYNTSQHRKRNCKAIFLNGHVADEAT